MSWRDRKTFRPVSRAEVVEIVEATAPTSGGPASVLDLADLEEAADPAWVIAHRGGGGWLAPENTVEAGLLAISRGAKIIDGGDWYTARGGGLVLCHDATLDRTTTLVGNAVDISAVRAQLATVDSSAWFGGGWPDLKLPSAAEWFGRLGNRAILCPEPKDAASANLLAAIIQSYGLQRSVLPNAFTLSWLAPFKAVGCPYLFLNVNSMPTSGDFAAYHTAGITHLGINNTFTAAQAQAIIDAGFKVIIGTLDRHYQKAPYAGVDVTGWVSDDPFYFSEIESTYKTTKDPFGSQSWGDGMLPYVGYGPTALGPTRRGAFTAPNKWRAPISHYFVLQGWAAKLPATFTIDLTVTFATIGSDVTRWAGIWLGADDREYQDKALATENGAQVWLRANGALEAVVKTNGASGANAPVTGAAPVAGAAVPLRIQKTATQIIVTRTDTGQTLTRNDARTLPYLFFGQHGGDSPTDSGLRIDFSGVTVT